MIKWEQMVFLGNPEYGCDLQPIDFAAFAAACGGDGLHRRGPGRDRHGPRQALCKSHGPAVIEAVVDPNEPPMPPKATVKQGLHLAQALARGTTDGAGIIGTVLENRVREMV